MKSIIAQTDDIKKNQPSANNGGDTEQDNDASPNIKYFQPLSPVIWSQSLVLVFDKHSNTFSRSCMGAKEQ